jgi:hypothetical protein
MYGHTKSEVALDEKTLIVKEKLGKKFNTILPNKQQQR